MWPDEDFRAAPRGALQLMGDEVHVWRIPLDERSEKEVDALRRLLSPDELARAKGFRFGVHARRYVVGRAALRLILSRYVVTHPAAIRFNYGAYGKPALAGLELAFNLAHSEDLALCAVARSGPLGVDVERTRALPDAHRLAEGFFSPVERSALRSAPAEERDATFLRCWTRKEAYLKAVGHGLAGPLSAFSVPVSPHDCTRIWGASESGAAGDWAVHHLEPRPDFIGAVVASGAPRRIRRWQWELTWALPI